MVWHAWSAHQLVSQLNSAGRQRHGLTLEEITLITAQHLCVQIRQEVQKKGGVSLHILSLKWCVQALSWWRWAADELQGNACAQDSLNMGFSCKFLIPGTLCLVCRVLGWITHPISSALSITAAPGNAKLLR